MFGGIDKYQIDQGQKGDEDGVNQTFFDDNIDIHQLMSDDSHCCDD